MFLTAVIPESALLAATPCPSLLSAMSLSHRQRNASHRHRRLKVEPLEARLALAGDITSGLVHYWTFDETSGDIAHDSAGGSDATLGNWTPTEPKWGTGRVGGALRFDSADNYVIASNPGISSSFAISFWLNAASRDGVFARIVTPKVGNVVFVGNQQGKGVSYTQNDNTFTYSAEPPTFNTWEHYAINFNSATGQAVIFRGGAPVAIGAYADSAPVPWWVIGHHFSLNNNDQSLDGALDDFRVYDRVLKDEDIAQLASLGVPAPVHTEPVHHWTFDETTGFTAFDTAGGANGTLVNWNQTEPRWQPGRVGGALRFSTADDAVVTPAIGTGAQWSIAFWLNVTAKTGTNPRIVTGTDNSALANLLFEFNGGVSFSSGNINTFDATPPTLNHWNHFAITYDTIADVGTIYRDGKVVATGFFGQNSPAFPWVFGHNFDLTNANDSLNGLLDDLRVYDRLLAPGEIADLALQGDPQPVPTSLTHHWTFDETTGDIAADIVGGNDGVLHNWSASQAKWVPGKIGRAISFNDAEHLIFTQLPITQDQYTFSFWLNQTGEGGFNPRIITPGDHREDWVMISQVVNKGVGFGGSDAQDPNVPIRNTWEQYVVTLDRVSGGAAVYRNGVKVDTGTFHELPALLPWYIGHHSDLDIHRDTLNGLLDDMRIYDRVLTDAEAMRLATGNFLLTTNDSYTTSEDTLLSVPQSLGVLKNDSNLNTNSKTTLEINSLHGTVDLKVDGRFTYKPADNYSGSDSFVYRLTDNLGNSVLATVALAVNSLNDAPTFRTGPNVTASDEDALLASTTTIGFDDLTGAPDNLLFHYQEGDFTVTALKGRWIEAHDPSHITGHPAPAVYGDTYNATLEIKRTSGGTFALFGFDLASWEFDFFATNSPVQYTVEGLLNGQTLYSSTGQVATSDFHAILGLPANFIDTLRFHMVRVDSQAYILDNIRLVMPGTAMPIPWATAIATGAPDEAAQKLNFTVTTDKPELFLIQPAVDPAGKLTFVPQPNVSGLANVFLALRDDGGTANGGSDTSPTQTFTINIVKEHPWHNVGHTNDVDEDGELSASDVIAIINYINAGFPDTVPAGNPAVPSQGYLDADGDNSISAGDALAVINAINAAPAKPSASFLSTDSATQGNWIGKYGSDGYSLNSGPSTVPAYAQISFKSGLTEIYDYVVPDANANPQALQLPGSTDRLLATWTGDYGFMLELNLRDTRAHRVTLYMPGPRHQRMDVIDANTGKLLDTRVGDPIDGGQYFTWNLTGHVKIRFSNLANGLNAVLSGIFFD